MCLYRPSPEGQRWEALDHVGRCGEKHLSRSVCGGPPSSTCPSWMRKLAFLLAEGSLAHVRFSLLLGRKRGPVLHLLFLLSAFSSK